MDEKRLLRIAKHAIRRGDRETGQQVLRQVIRENRESEVAWLWLSAIVDDPAREQNCLKRVLRINPNNEVARRHLARLAPSRPQAPSRPAPTTSGQDAPPRPHVASTTTTSGFSAPRQAPVPSKPATTGQQSTSTTAEEWSIPDAERPPTTTGFSAPLQPQVPSMPTTFGLTAPTPLNAVAPGSGSAAANLGDTSRIAAAVAEAAPPTREAPAPANASRGSPAAGAFAGVVCLLDGLLLLGVALMQLSEGGLGVLFGLWNLGVTVAYVATAVGLFSVKEGAYRWALRLALGNIGLLFMQMNLWNALGASEESLVPMLILIGGDIVLAIVLGLTRKAILVPPKPEEIATPQALEDELDSVVVEASGAAPRTSVAAGNGLTITPEERDMFVRVRNTFIAEQSGRALVGTETDVKAVGENIDLITRDWSGTVFTLGRVPAQECTYLFRPVVDRDVLEWVRSTVWKHHGGNTVVVAVTASPHALETCGGRFGDPGRVGVYTLRGGQKSRKGRALVGGFERWYRRWCRRSGVT